MSLSSMLRRRRAPLLIAATLVAASIIGAGRVVRENTTGVAGASWREVPVDLGLDARDVSFPSSNGTLVGWWIPSRTGAAVVFTHGLQQNRADMLARAAVLARAGTGVLLYDLHAHGLSDGAVFGTSWRAAEDVRAAVGFVLSQPDVDPARIGAFGFSVGGASTLRAAIDERLLAAVFVDGTSSASFKDDPVPASLIEWALVPADAFYWPLLSLRLRARQPTPLIELLPRLADRPVFYASAGPVRAQETRRAVRYAARTPAVAGTFAVPEAGHGGGMAARPAEYGAVLASFFDAALRTAPVDERSGLLGD